MQKFIITCCFTTLILTISASVFAQNNSVTVSQYQTDDFLNSVKMNDVKAVKKALSNGISPNLMDTQGNSALALAITEKSIDVIKLLVDTPSIDLERPNLAGETPVMMMAYNGMYDLLVYLVDKRDVDINKPGWTALHYAATNGHERIASYLLDKHAYIDALSPNGTTPLMMAARGGHIHVVKLLLDRGADLSKRNGLKMTAIEFAEQNNQSEIAAGLKSRWSKVYGKPYAN
ncbi:MAG: ankyrin repeat protein containing three repeat [Pseudomonadota bacterium]